jgi:diguanylate cyclase (GGDEF)-like protein
MQPFGTANRTTRQLKTLLIIPDDDAREMLELVLSMRGHTVTTCRDMAAAHAALASCPSLAFVVVGHDLPDTDYLAACADIRATAAGREATLLVIARSTNPEERTAALQAGADGILPWPADTDLLREHMDAAEGHLVHHSADRATRSRQGGDVLLVMSADGTVIRAGTAVEALLGFPPEALVGVNAFSFFHPQDTPALLGMVIAALTTSGESQPVELRVRRQGDAWRAITLCVANHLSDADMPGIAFHLRGADARAQVIDQRLRAAMHDRVTDLPNRSLFIDRVDHAVARANRRQQPVVVMAVDFNGFTPRDAATPRAVGDGLVIALAQRLRSCLRTSDTAARLGHDEFALLLEEIVDPENIAIVANRIVQSMTVPFVEGGEELELVPNIGIAVSTPERDRAVDLLQDAAVARAWARVQGSGRYVMFDPLMGTPEPEHSPPAPLLPATGVHRVDSAPGMLPPNADERFAELHERLAGIEASLARLMALITDERRVSLPT